jgi:HTH-type transcriptional regulator/antitoxin HipB
MHALTPSGYMRYLTPSGYKKGKPVETVNRIRLAVRGKRRALGLSQAQVAQRAGVSRKWLSEFEQGKVKVELGLVLRLLDSLDLQFSVESKHSTQTQNANSDLSKKPTAHTIDIVKFDLDKLLSEYQS